MEDTQRIRIALMVAFFIINTSDDSDLYLFIVLVPNNQNISKLYASGDNP